MIHYFLYKKATGEVLGRCFGTQEAAEAELNDDIAMLILPEGTTALTDVTSYIDIATHTLSEKTENPATISGQVISNIHNPSVVDCGELGRYDVTDGEFEFTIDTPGTYQIIVESVPYKNISFSVEVV